MLYFIKSQNYLKIGYSQDFETLIDRMTSYITHNPDFVLLSFTEYGTTKDEKALHKLLKEFNHYSEWFNDNLKVYEIWEEYIMKKNLVPKNCFYNFPQDLEKFKSLNYKQTWDSTLLPTIKESMENKEEIEILLLKYFGLNKTFTQEDFVRVCKFSEKEIGNKVNKCYLESFGYIISNLSEEIITLKKISFKNINLISNN